MSLKTVINISINISTLQKKKLKSGELKWLTQVYPIHKWWDSNSALALDLSLSLLHEC